MGRVKRIWYLSRMWAAKVQASLCIRAVSPEPPLLAHTSSESRVTFRQKARSLAPLNGWTCAVKICHEGMLKDTNWLDRALMLHPSWLTASYLYCFRFAFITIYNVFCILSINEKLPLTRVHLTQEHIWIFLDRALPSVQLSFLWCTVLWIGTIYSTHECTIPFH